jgi:large subunit ribosomal protein L10
MAEYVTKLQQFKLDAIDELKQDFQSARDYILADYRGLNVAQITALRNRLRENGTRFKVVKNRYVKIAMKDLNMPEISDQLLGPTAIALTTDEAGSAAKILVEFSNDTTLTLKGGIIDGQIFSGEQVKQFSRLPAKDALLSMLMSAMNGPVRGLLYALQAVPQKLVRTLQAVAEKKGAEAS